MKQNFTATIVEENGLKRLALSNTPYFRTRIQKMKTGKVQLTVDELTPLRSGGQHRFYWVYLTQIAEETGDTPEALHEVFKDEFLPREFLTAMGRAVEKTKSTKTLNKNDFSEYLMKIEERTGIPCPSPEDAGYIPNK